MSDRLILINQKLIEILSANSGYFGRVDTWGQKPAKYEYIGYELTIDFFPTLLKMTGEQQKTLIKTINYFEIHAHPLRNLLETEQEYSLYKFYTETAWSHFMTVVMFGILEITIKEQVGSKVNKKGDLLNKGDAIKLFLEKNLSEKVKESIAQRYSLEELSIYQKGTKNFSDVIDHLWHEIRCGFIHNGTLESTGLEWNTLSGIGTRENPLIPKVDVPMQEFLQITWQTILNSYGYTGFLKLPTYKKNAHQSNLK